MTLIRQRGFAAHEFIFVAAWGGENRSGWLVRFQFRYLFNLKAIPCLFSGFLCFYFWAMAAGDLFGGFE